MSDARDVAGLAHDLKGRRDSFSRALCLDALDAWCEADPRRAAGLLGISPAHSSSCHLMPDGSVFEATDTGPEHYPNIQEALDARPYIAGHLQAVGLSCVRSRVLPAKLG